MPGGRPARTLPIADAPRSRISDRGAGCCWPVALEPRPRATPLHVAEVCLISCSFRSLVVLPWASGGFAPVAIVSQSAPDLGKHPWQRSSCPSVAAGSPLCQRPKDHLRARTSLPTTLTAHGWPLGSTSERDLAAGGTNVDLTLALECPSSPSRFSWIS